MAYPLSCHCRARHIAVDAELTGLHECNCSTCMRFADTLLQPLLGFAVNATERRPRCYFALETLIALRRFASA